MPEIKHTFSAGKMNKDLNERLVPNGEYRHAMNIEVSTSEGSSVGAVQNILGNTNLAAQKSFVTAFVNPKCVGVVADEANNCFYWLVAADNKDCILRYTSTHFTWVFVDVNKNSLKFDPSRIITGINIIDNLLFWTDNFGEPKKINIELCIIGTRTLANDGTEQTRVHNPLSNSIDSNLISDSSTFMTEDYVTVIKPAPKKAPDLTLIALNNLNVPGIIENYKFSDSNDVLWGPGSYSDSTSIIPGSNGWPNGPLLPGAAPWCDENPQACIDEPNGTADINFLILNSSINQDYNISPGKSIVQLKAVDVQDVGYDDTGGSSYIDRLSENFNQEYSYTPDYDIRLLITTSPSPNVSPDGANELSGSIDVHAEILSIRQGTRTNATMWVVNFEQATDSLFEDKFVRFAYRYKYIDQEHSPISPFTTVAFQPSIYSYDQTAGYNYGMKNYLSGVKLSKYIEKDMRADVIGIDLLYKESNSPSVYVVEEISIKNMAPIFPSGPYLSETGEYTITSDTIYKLLPSSQMLRPFDNVPRKALAQEVVGNRIVYGNYVQNFTNVDGNDELLDLDLTYGSSGVTVNDEIGVPSLKTLREYQVGVVWEDKYGRQTPINTNESSTIKIPILESTNPISFNAKINSAAPAGAEYLKFFIKEASNEYYNLALDRWYNAKDGNIWLSFNSVDRNKIDEETYLYLKKSHGSDKAITIPTKYKIISVENSAPSYIRKNRLVMGELTHNSTDDNVLFFDSTFLPIKDKVEFKLNKESVESSGINGINTNQNELSLVFKKISTNSISDRYRITSVVFDDIRGDNYLFTISGEFGSDVKFMEDATSTANAPVIENGISIEITESKVENGAEFDGKFFVKINRDFNIDNFIIGSKNTDDMSIIHQEPLLFLTQSNITNRFTFLGGNDFDLDGNGNQTIDYTDAYDYGKEVFGDGSTTNTSDDNGPRWFIDELRHEGEHVEPSTYGAYDTTNSTPGVNNAIIGDKIYISYGGIEVPYNDPNNPYNNVGQDHLWWTVGEASNPETYREKDMVDRLVPGQKFSWANDPDGVVYTIKNVDIKKLYNYADGFQSVNGTDPSKTPQGFGGWDGFIHPANRRKTWILTLDIPIGSGPGGYDPTDADATASTAASINFIGNATNTIDKAFDRSKNPAIFETKPKETLDIDIYHEASNSIALVEQSQSIATEVVVWLASGDGYFTNQSGVSTTNVQSEFGDGNMTVSWGNVSVTGGITSPLTIDNPGVGYNVGDLLTIDNPNGSSALIKVTQATIVPNTGPSSAIINLNWFNCYIFGNGVESNRIQDDFNAQTIDNGPKVSTVFDGEYKEERLKNGLIYSGIYSSLNSFNRTNEFITAEKITKNINPTYGSIQKLYSRDSDLVTFCEDKVLKILSNKDALFNADGNPQLVATDKVLGQTIPFSGDYGISKNPESFAKQNYRIYFTDKQRGSVLRLSRDGITPISEYGMSDWFKDHLKESDTALGSIDARKDNYNLTLFTYNNLGSDYTLSFDDTVNGWVSFKSFIPQHGVSVNNEYFTFWNGMPWKHHDGPYNNFYDVFEDASVGVILNDLSGSVKNFKTISYEGSQSRIDQNQQDNNFYNLSQISGWHIDTIETDLESGYLNEFVNKEGKWFNYIKGKPSQLLDTSSAANPGINTSEFLFQGIGTALDINGQAPVTYTLTIRDIPDQD